jgi:sec-independent protein translocase protein TatA
MFDRIGLPELIIVLVIVMLVFGAGKLPEIGKALGKSIHEFKKAKDDGDDSKKDAEKPAQVSIK